MKTTFQLIYKVEKELNVITPKNAKQEGIQNSDKIFDAQQLANVPSCVSTFIFCIYTTFFSLSTVFKVNRFFDDGFLADILRSLSSEKTFLFRQIQNEMK